MKQLIKAIKTTALEFGDFTTSSGMKTNFYLDVKKLTLSGQLTTIIWELHSVLGETEFNAIGGPTVGADPIVGGFLAVFGNDSLHGFLVRPAEKDHGKVQRIIGSIQKGDQCIVVDDVTTTGESLLDACDEVIKYGGTVVMAIAVVDRLQGAEAKFAARNIPFKSFVTIADVFNK